MEYILNKDIDGKEITLRQLQLVLVDILKDIDKVCKKNKIEYILFSGTALGAVRHQGFIPWDDDLDIAVMRDQYDKFIEAVKKDLPDKYVIQCFDTDPRFLVPYPAVKIRLKNTFLAEKNIFLKNKCYDCTGIFVDVFVLNYVSEDCKLDRKWRRKNLWLSYLITLLENLDINPVYLKRKFIKNAIDYGNLNRGSKLIGDEITWVYRNINKPYVYKKEDIFPTKKVLFEGLKLPMPNNPEGLLTPHYGRDYMTPIPQKKQKPTHVTFVSLSSDCSNKNRPHFPFQNLMMVFSMTALILVVWALILFDEVSFFMSGMAIILLGIVLMLLINRKS